MWEAVAAVASVAAVFLSALAFGRSIRSDRRAGQAQDRSIEARDAAVAAQRDMAERLDAIAKAQEQTLADRQAEAEARRGGRLSAALVKQGRSERVIIENVGHDPLTVVDVDIPESAAVHGAGSPVGVDLDPGETFGILVGLSMDTPLPMEVGLRWRDDRGEQERVQHLTL